MKSVSSALYKILTDLIDVNSWAINLSPFPQGLTPTGVKKCFYRGKAPLWFGPLHFSSFTTYHIPVQAPYSTKAEIPKSQTIFHSFSKLPVSNLYLHL